MAGQVRVRLTSTVPRTVGALALEWSGLPGLPPTAPGYPLQPRVPVDLPVPLGPADCGDPPRANAPVPAMDVSVLVDGERVPVSGAGPTLTRVFERACRQQALQSLAAASFGPTWAPVDDGRALRGTLRLQRLAATGPVRVAALDGSVLLTPVPDDPLPATMTGTGLDLPVTVTSSGRCDGHALGESKQTYVFDLLVDVADEAGLDGVQPLTVSVPEEVRPAMWDALQRACAASG